MSTHCLGRGTPCSVLAARMLAPAVRPIPFKMHYASSLDVQLALHSILATVSSRPISEEFETEMHVGKMHNAAAHCSDKKPQEEAYRFLSDDC